MDRRSIEHLLNAANVLSVIVPSFFLTVISTNLSSTFINEPNKIKKSFSLEYFILVVPVILYCTILSDYTEIMNLMIVAITVLVTCFNYKRINAKDLEVDSCGTTKSTVKHYLSSTRSIINLITVVCILAVDFSFFPHRYHKTARYGVSLMDVGVGLYVYANGIVACEIRGVKNSIQKTFLNVLPILVIGLLRFVTTYMTHYHVNPHEYGVHWNFFITLAVTKLLSSILMTFIVPSFKSCLGIGIFIISVHQFLLEVGLTKYVFSNLDRDNLLDANREGIVSSLGYVGLYFLSVATGFIFHTFKKKQRIFWAMLIGTILLVPITIILHEMFNISRCLANSTYISWILLIAYLMTFLLFAYEQLLNYFYSNHQSVVYSPLLFEAVNYNGLTYFLIANLLTGFINLSIETGDVEDELALLIMFVYMFLCSWVVVFLYNKKIKLKL